MEQLFATACAKSLRVSPTKVRLLADLVRGKKVGQAIAILNNCQSPVKEDILKVLNSAIANAVNNEKADAKTLYVKEARVDAGPVMKRHFFDSRSRIGHRDHRTSHIIVVVATRN